MVVSRAPGEVKTNLGAVDSVMTTMGVVKVARKIIFHRFLCFSKLANFAKPNLIGQITKNLRRQQ